MLGGDSKPIPKEVRLPMGITISMEPYLPDILKQCSIYSAMVPWYANTVSI